jgi:formylglycine-generating enzyme required for sulfatase activity/tRNA A-37 threonylcarbamoyl transferase component Bud32
LDRVNPPLPERERLAAALSGRYSVEQELGQGGMAVVYRARDLKHDRLVAIKVLKPQLAHALGPDRFLREIKLTAQLSHPHILPLLDSGDADGLLYYVMPYVEGESLRHRLERDPGKPVPLDEALRITREVADGLESAHRHGVIHRDIKPENILIEEGHAVIADFGIARAVAESGGAADARLTATGIAVGTPDYMSPEQRLGGRAGPIDARTDVYALACVLSEMLTGELPRPSAPRRALPEGVDRAVRRALSDAPEQRFDSAAAFIAALPPPRAGADLGAVARLIRRPAYAIPAGVLVLLAILAIILPGRARAARERGREQLARAALLADSGRYAPAYAALTEAERALPGDSAVARLMPKVADIFTLTSEPAGARVYIQRFAAEAADHPGDSALLGETPIPARRMARGDYRLVIAKDGFIPVATPSAVHGSRPRRSGFRTGEAVPIGVRLVPADAAPPDMVLVPGGTYRLVGPKIPLGLEARLDDFFLDKYEVSNEQYRAFVAAGGYRPAALRRFTDKSGMAGPRGWTGQDYPQGQGRYPVTDVSWLEASAYCAAAGKRLPTVFEWEKAARNGLTAPGEGVMMPWGYVRAGDATSQRANFGGSGTAPVDAYPFGISTYGAYNMAGNVKEWTANPLQDGYGVTGGSWEDPIYLYSTFGALGAGAASRSLGFRCARVAGTAASGHDQGAFRIPFEGRTPRYTPVSAAAFRALLEHYRYDPRPLEAHVLETVVTPDWRRLKIRYVALEGDTALAYLYLPKLATAPFQAMVYICSSAAFVQVRTVPEEVEWAIGPNIRAGRAVLAPVLKGMAERGFGPGWEPPASNSVRFRDMMVLHATEMRRGVDYLASRDDIDMRRLTYIGLSWGAGSRITLAAVDDRFHAVVLLGGGIDERVQPTLPEASNINFAPYIRPPKLLLNGRDDEEHPWLTRALPLWNLLREPKQLVLVPGGGHMPPLEARVPAINRFLDQTLGPVRRAP